MLARISALLSHISPLQVLLAAAGGAIATAAMEQLADSAGIALMLVPFTTSIALVMGSPEAEPAQPRSLIGGHILSTLSGFALLWLAGSAWWAAALAVGLAIAAMLVTRTLHPPAAIDALIVVTGALPLKFLLVPVASGAALLAGFAFVWHNSTRRGSWPRHWW